MECKFRHFDTLIQIMRGLCIAFEIMGELCEKVLTTGGKVFALNFNLNSKLILNLCIDGDPSLTDTSNYNQTKLALTKTIKELVVPLFDLPFCLAN